jgi:hypothetical protein
MRRHNGFQVGNAMISTLSPLAIVLGIIFILAVVGALIALVYNLHKFSGFRDIGREVGKIARALNGELFRDGDDLVISGNFGGLPVVVRFSNKEDVPALNLRIGVPANFTLWIAPRSADPGEGRTTLRTGDALFDTRFVTRSDDPGQALLFLGLPAVPRTLHQLAVSSATFLALSPGSLEISELELPRDFASSHVLHHLKLAVTLAQALQQMPAADTVSVKPLRKEKRILARIAIVVGAAVAFALVIAATEKGTRKEVFPGRLQTSATGVLPIHATQIVGLDGWQVATDDDFDPDAAAWLRDSGVPVSGRVAGDFSGSGSQNDVAYVLVRSDGMRRLVMLTAGENHFDVRYPAIAIVARVPKYMVGRIRWIGQLPPDLAGDGLLIVRAAADPHSGLVLFTSHHRIVTAVPENYQTVMPD